MSDHTAFDVTALQWRVLDVAVLPVHCFHDATSGDGTGGSRNHGWRPGRPAGGIRDEIRPGSLANVTFPVRVPPDLVCQVTETSLMMPTRSAIAVAELPSAVDRGDRPAGGDAETCRRGARLTRLISCAAAAVVDNTQAEEGRSPRWVTPPDRIRPAIASRPPDRNGESPPTLGQLKLRTRPCSY